MTFLSVSFFHDLLYQKMVKNSDRLTQIDVSRLLQRSLSCNSTVYVHSRLLELTLNDTKYSRELTFHRAKYYEYVDAVV